MTYQATFQRYEMKYLLNSHQKEQILRTMEPCMKLDAYGRTTIRNIYFDTDSFRLIRRSLEKPVYKEKLRVRSYKKTEPGDPVFVELKKKYRSVVYKRRMTMPEDQASGCFRTGTALPADSQIAREIDYFRGFYGPLYPAVFLSYEREAFCSIDGSDFRVTFDENILYREQDMGLGDEIYGIPLLKKGQTLMEIKTSGGIPLWMSAVLTGNRLYQTSFSKYGAAYSCMAAGERKGGLRYA